MPPPPSCSLSLHFDPPRMGGSWLGVQVALESEACSGSGAPLWEGVGSRAAPGGLRLLLPKELLFRSSTAER